MHKVFARNRNGCAAGHSKIKPAGTAAGTAAGRIVHKRRTSGMSLPLSLGGNPAKFGRASKLNGRSDIHGASGAA